MRYTFVQKLLPLHKQSRVGYHLVCAVAAAHEDGDQRRDAILALLTDDERQAAKEAKK